MLSRAGDWLHALPMWSILPHLTACAAGESVFLLDLRQDRYFRVPPRLAGDMLAWLRGNDEPTDRVVDLLVRGGIWRVGDASLGEVTEHAVTVPISLPGERVERDRSAQDARRIAFVVARTWSALRLRPLQSLVRRRRSWRAARVWQDAELPQSRLEAFRRSRRLVPIKQNCLLDSLALDAWLAESGPDRRIVFGVTPEPFHAHCWLQSSGVILNDVYDHARQYTPILIV